MCLLPSVNIDFVILNKSDHSDRANVNKCVTNVLMVFNDKKTTNSTYETVYCCCDRGMFRVQKHTTTSPIVQLFIRINDRGLHGYNMVNLQQDKTRINNFLVYLFRFI